MQTTYNSITFRSRLEASWACFFDRARLRWEYEPQTFREGRFSYTPDFRVGGRAWVEVKGKTIPMNRSLRLCPRPLIVLFGNPSLHHAVLVTDRLVPLPSFDAAWRDL